MWLKYALLVLGVAHLIFGIVAVYAPGQTAGMMALETASPGGLGEMRAYGGLVVAIGIVLLRGAMGGPTGRQWLVVVAMLYSGLAIGRIVSLAGDGIAFHTVASLAVEGLIAAFLFYAASGLEGVATPASAPPMDPVDGIEE